MALASVSAAEVPAWAMAFESMWSEAYNSRNPEGFKGYYADDARVNEWQGMEAIVAGISKAWEEENVQCADALRSGFEPLEAVCPYR